MEKRPFSDCSIECPPRDFFPRMQGGHINPGKVTPISLADNWNTFLLTMNLKERYPAFGGRGPSDMSVGIALGVVATIFIALRIYVRLRINTFGTSALIWALFAWTCTVVTQICGVIAALHGLGNHMTVIMAEGNLHTYLLFTWITVFFFNLAIPAGKVAVSAYLIEMNGQGNPKIRRSLIAVATLNVVLNIPQVFLVWFQCTPSDALWDPLRQTQCDHRRNVYYTYFVGAVAALSDFYLAIIPINMFMPLRIDRKLKWGLCFLMGCGLFAGVAAIVRTWAAKFILTKDSSYGVATLFLWGEVEEWVVLITMCIPPVWPLFRPYAQQFIKNTSSRSHPRNYTLPYNRTAQEASSSKVAWPPRVTTTISVTSVMDKTAVPSRTSSEFILKHNEHHGETPYNNVFHDKKTQDTWVELSDLEEHPNRR